MIKIAKLVSGEFVIGQDEGGFLINVLLIRFNVNQTSGEIIHNLIPYMAPISNSLGKMIPYDKIITSIPATDDLNVKYIKAIELIIKAATEYNSQMQAPINQTQGPMNQTQGPINQTQVPIKQEQEPIKQEQEPINQENKSLPKQDDIKIIKKDLNEE